MLFGVLLGIYCVYRGFPVGLFGSCVPVSSYIFVSCWFRVSFVLWRFHSLCFKKKYHHDHGSTKKTSFNLVTIKPRKNTKLRQSYFFNIVKPLIFWDSSSLYKSILGLKRTIHEKSYYCYSRLKKDTRNPHILPHLPLPPGLP